MSKDKWYTLLNDTMFKLVFRKNIDILEKILRLVPELSDTNLLYLPIDPHSKLDISAKSTERDLKVLTENYDTIITEMHNGVEDGFSNRMFIYNYQDVASQTGMEGPYTKYKNVILVLFLNGILYKDSSNFYERIVSFREIAKKRVNGLSVIHIFELPKVNKNSQGKIIPWLLFFKLKTREEYMEAARNNEDMERIYRLIDYYNARDDFKEMMRYKEKDRLDQMNREAVAREAGKAESIIGILSNMVKLKMPMSQMELITGLSSAKINQYIADSKID